MYGIYKLKIIEAFQLDDFLNCHMKILYNIQFDELAHISQSSVKSFLLTVFIGGRIGLIC